MWRNLFNVFNKENLYQQAIEESHKMLDIDLRMIEASVQSLRYASDVAPASDILAMDKQINRFERDVRRKVLTHLAISGPAELSSGLVLVSIIIDIERIGDYAKNICDLAGLHPAKLHGGDLESAVLDIEQRTLALFRDTVAAFCQNDPDMARKVMSGYKESLSGDCEAVIRAVLQNPASDLRPETAAAIVLYVRYLKRIAAHSRNIVTSVVNPFPRIGYREKS